MMRLSDDLRDIDALLNDRSRPPGEAEAMIAAGYGIEFEPANADDLE